MDITRETDGAEAPRDQVIDYKSDHHEMEQNLQDAEITGGLCM